MKRCFEIVTGVLYTNASVHHLSEWDTMCCAEVMGGNYRPLDRGGFQGRKLY